MKDLRCGRFVRISTSMQEFCKVLRQIASSDACASIRGEKGTGKGLAARVIHRLSSRSGGPLIYVEAGALNESEISRPLWLESAHHGTLVLREITELSMPVQKLLLHLLQQGWLLAEGADVRVLTTSTRCVQKALEDRRFREDLHCLLHVFSLTVPPLRERKQDLRLLLRQFIREFNHKYQTCVKSVRREVFQLMKSTIGPVTFGN